MIKRKNEQEVEVRKNMRGGAGEISIRHYFKPHEMTAKVRLCSEMQIPPGAGVGPHEHSGEDEIYIVQQGRGRMVDGDKEIEVAAGDVVLTGKGASHSIQNTGTEDLVVTAIIILY